jgi:isochorismate pyruvate lyase
MTEDEQAAVDAAECTTMAEVRDEIDRIDRLLVRLIAERQGYIEAAGRIKIHRETVRDPWRIEDVVAKVLAAAEREGLSKRIAEPVWRELIERCIAHEDEVFLLQQAPQRAKKVS